MPTTMKNITILTGRDPASHPLSIVRIEIERLFGKYSYVLENPPGNLDLSSPLIIIYGDNGSGKTTILKLLFHLFSNDWERGDRSFVAETPFARFSVLLADETQLVASREDDKLTGSFKLSLRRGKDREYELIYHGSERGCQSYVEDKGFIEKLSNLELNCFLMMNNRVLDSDLISEKYLFELERETTEIIPRDFLWLEMQAIAAREKSSINRETALRASIRRAEAWLRDRTLMGADKRVDSVNAICEKIIEAMIDASDAGSKANGIYPSPEKAIEQLEEQETRSHQFSCFGLMSPLDHKKIIGLLQKKLGANKFFIIKILTSYLDSVSARFQALEEIQTTLAVFVDRLNNTFLRDKKITWQVREGIKILTDSGYELSLKSLSSGEKQILLLFCNALTARDKATLFTIDEPEISLNIKWQRLLLRALLELTEGSQVQFIIATHSIELLSQYNRNVVELENLNEVRDEA